MTDNHHDTRLVPHHQRIITSSQWVFDKNREEPTSTPTRSSSVSSMASNSSVDHRTHHVQIKPKASPTSSVDREARRKTKELENMKLQMEYNSARQENDKLKNVIAKLKQEIETYTKILEEKTGCSPELQNAPPMSSLLVNNTKRRKKSESKPHKQEKTRQRQSRPDPAKQDLEIGVNPSVAFPQGGLPNIIPTNKIMTNDVMFGALNAEPETPLETKHTKRRQNKQRKNAKSNNVGADEVSPDDIMLMHTLTDVLAHME
ncbi:uncharacterized protein ZBAI_07848 [Zygosaccharomyces bailii ISA1307]|nr:uncharacterized protein ZBAI_07848 [Zygosaccharomyces bailii ISA1307]